MSEVHSIISQTPSIPSVTPHYLQNKDQVPQTDKNSHFVTTNLSCLVTQFLLHVLYVVGQAFKEDWPSLSASSSGWGFKSDAVCLVTEEEKHFTLVSVPWFTNCQRVALRRNAERVREMPQVVGTQNVFQSPLLSLVPRTVPAHSGYSLHMCWMNKTIFSGTKIHSCLFLMVKIREVFEVW